METEVAAGWRLSVRFQRGWVSRSGLPLLLARVVAWSCVLAGLPLHAQQPDVRQVAPVVVPRIDGAPTLEDFLEMKPSQKWEGKLAKIDGFVQRDPKDGAPPTFRTEVYLGYTDKNLYVIFVCFDAEPKSIRARMSRRENVYDDELVQIMLDTFHDQRRAYSFVTNPLGIQLDRLYAEGQGFDDSFDTLWQSEGKVNDHGYVVWMAIPFRSLRFPRSGQTWGIVLQRIIPRLNEVCYWPHISSRIEGRLNQEGTMRGLEGI